MSPVLISSPCDYISVWEKTIWQRKFRTVGSMRTLSEYGDVTDENSLWLFSVTSVYDFLLQCHSLINWIQLGCTFRAMTCGSK